MDTILQSQDIKNISPDLTIVGRVPVQDALQSQTTLIGRDDENQNLLHLITTNNIPEKYRSIKKQFERDGYEIEDHFTDWAWFDLVLWRYTQMQHDLDEQQIDHDNRLHATWEKAIRLIRSTFKDHQTYSEEQFIFELLRLSYMAWASDVHFQSEENGIVMRLRIDWVLKYIVTFEHAERKKYLMKLKFISGVKMNRSTVSQDWRFDFELEWTDQKLDVRVSVLPGLRWESIVMRFLDATKGLMTFENIWFEDYHIQMLEHQLSKNFWMILVTWPTWSWKTTTVYSLINYLNSSEKKIITLEDPVEYEVAGIEQSQINQEKWYTFEQWLKGILRHDPDIIVVWEIRTLETAQMAINAALTWHLVISTLHTNSSVETIPRLINMWVKPYMLASALNMIIGQRLVRKLTTRETYTPNKADDAYIQQIISHITKYTKHIKVSYDGTLQRPIWWERARTTWYHWRVAILEMLPITQSIKEAIISNDNAHTMYQIAYKDGFLSLEHNAMIKVLRWVTSLAEVRRGLWT